MARSRLPEVQARDGSSSEEEEEEESSEEDEESESESEEEGEEKDKAPAPSIKRPLPFPLKKPETTQTSTRRKISFSDESESDSANPNVKPPASKAMEETTKKPKSKHSSVTPVAKSTKRPLESENNNHRELKRAKKKLEEDADRVAAADTAKKTGDDSKKQLFQRLWNEDDEIVILKGMSDYKEKKGADPVTEMKAFHDFIKKSLHVEVSKVQLSDKLRRLRKKIENNFKKTHEKLAYEWSKKIWGGGGDDANGGVVESSKLVGGKAYKKSQTKMAVEANSASRSSIGKSGLDDDDIVKDGLELISEAKRAELEEKWSKFRMQEIELYLRRLHLIQDQAKLVLKALKSSSGN